MKYDREKFKAAHRKADYRLAKTYVFEYKIFRVDVQTEQPELEDPEIGRHARMRLREIYPHTFIIFYNEEKKKLGLPENRDFKALAIEIVELYNNGTGLTMRQIAAELGVSYSTVQRKIRKARRKDAENQAESCTDGDGPPMGGRIRGGGLHSEDRQRPRQQLHHRP